MSTFFQARTWIAASAAIAAGLLVWMLPALPDWKVSPPEVSRLHALSPGGRHVVTYTNDGDDLATILVWDTTRWANEPTLTIRANTKWWHTHFSPDGSTLAFARVGKNDLVDEVHCYDLASGERTATWPVVADVVFYTTEGKLAYFKDRVLRSLEDDQVLGRLPEEIDGFKKSGFHSHVHEFVVYNKDHSFKSENNQLLVYSAISGKEVARMKVPGNWQHVRAISRDGRVINTYGWAPGSSPWHMSDFQVLADADGIVRPSRETYLNHFHSLSPNGDWVVTHGPMQRAEWMKKWWPIKDNDSTFHITDWRTDARQAEFRNVQHLEFSPDSEHVATLRADGVVEGYRWPLRKPWGLLAVSMLTAALGTWCAAWLWSKWRRRGPAIHPSPSGVGREGRSAEIPKLQPSPPAPLPEGEGRPNVPGHTV